jgi:hypothetical protein|tara:strand:+ start:4807 stop:6534 length:1728 start_codon:yes stop_codon:yes gene_type:complete
MSYFYIKKEEFNVHLIFLFILSLFYLIPYFWVGQLILNPHDLLDSEIVYNHIIGRIYRGDIESINLFLAGEIKWYFLKGILQPQKLLYAFFETETAYWLTDILIKLIAYTCFFKLSRRLNCSLFNSALIACLFASYIDAKTHFGVGIAVFPYLIYLVTKNKNLSLKHYCLLALIGLNFDLPLHMSIIPVLFFTSLILCPKYQKYNFKLFFKISFVLIFFIFLSNLNLIYTQLFSEPSFRTSYFIKAPDLITNFKSLMNGFFSIPTIIGNSYFFHYLPFTCYQFFITLISLFSKNRISYLLLLLIFLIISVGFILDLEFVNSIRNSKEGLFKTIHWRYIFRTLPVLYGLLFVVTPILMIKRTKYLIYPIIFFSLITAQIRVSMIPLGKHFISFNNLTVAEKSQLRKSFHDQKYSLLIKDIIKFKEDKAQYPKQSSKSLYTFKGYYDYENYKYIKSLVGDSRTISIGLDPMAAVVNDISVIDGYHSLYPLSYKLKFRKIIEKQLDYNPKTKKYYDDWGGRVYTFVGDPKVIKIDFREANFLGAEYVISKYPISNQFLLSICEKCNNSAELFLYKIII